MRLFKMPSLLLMLLIFISSCKKNEDLKVLRELFDYKSYEVDSTIRVIGPVQNKIYKSQVPFESSESFNAYGFPTILVLENDHLMMAVSRYTKLTDWGLADIALKESFDNGKTWGAERAIQNNIGAIQTVAPSLLRLGETNLGLFFLVKHSNSSCDVYLKKSNDNGLTWGGPRKINTINGYNIMNNDRILKIADRLIVPVSFTSDVSKYGNKMGCFCYISDDLGENWRVSSTISTTLPLMEPGVIQIEDTEELLMVMRSIAGKIIFSRSYNLGETWTTPTLTNLVSPESPSTIATVRNTNKLVLIWNNRFSPDPDSKYRNRYPLTMAFSSDKGKTWENGRNVEWATDADYAYPVFFQNNSKTYLFYNVAPHAKERIYTKMLDIED